ALVVLHREATAALPEVARAEVQTPRQRLWKGGAVGRTSARRLGLHFSGTWPYRGRWVRGRHAVQAVGARARAGGGGRPRGGGGCSGRGGGRAGRRRGAVRGDGARREGRAGRLSRPRPRAAAGPSAPEPLQHPEESVIPARTTRPRLGAQSGLSRTAECF